MNITNKHAQSQVSLDTSLPGLVHEPLVTLRDQAEARYEAMTKQERWSLLGSHMNDVLDLPEVDRFFAGLVNDADPDPKILKQKIDFYLIDLIESDMREEQRREANDG